MGTTEQERNLHIRNVISNLAIEEMYLDKNFINELIKVEKGEKTSDQLRREIISKYGR